MILVFSNYIMFCMKKMVCFETVTISLAVKQTKETNKAFCGLEDSYTKTVYPQYIYQKKFRFTFLYTVQY